MTTATVRVIQQMFPDLIVNDKWRFNSSAAEVTNAWFGGFQSIVREMRVD